ncbi:MAG TPA: ATP-dependent DNA helicase RecG [Candidatus Saccharimonadales bacterium]|nr:ATP-dependent DNA helicase RecG [Candidatus Saccharimonadales bacterium]
MTVESPLVEVKGVGDSLVKKYASLGLHTIDNIINYYPRRYDDYSVIQPIVKIKPGVVTIKATIKQVRGRYVRRGLHITEAVASDETSSVRLVWFNQPYRAAAIKPGADYFISGQFELSRQRLAIMNPSMELASDFPVNTARIVPIYKEIKGLKSMQIRRTLREVVPVIDKMPETLPDWLIKQHKLVSYSEALKEIHFPASREQLQEARRRLGFEEVFHLALAALLNKYELLQEKALSIPFKESLAREFVKHLPFKLTDAQRIVIWQMYQDLQKTSPMNRLLEGDVGSGKTVVATMVALMALEQGFQVAFMAPTELLARQHAETIYKLLEPSGYESQVGLLVGSLKPAEKTLAHQRIATGDIRLIIGTHALIQEKVDIHKLGLVVIDEQHRFGVDQRKKLQAKAGHALHVLNMTATPIPRSLALTLYGELDISIIDAKPSERLPIITKICSPNSRKQLYEEIDVEIDKGRQVFVVAPLIHESNLVPGSRSAEQVYKELSEGPFKHRRVGLLHGQMKAPDKNQMMDDYIAHKLDILVATTVIEVGVDVPNATVMLIEDAERFGLAQIHQLRGRVGRSTHQGYAYLMLNSSKAPSRRLRALESSSDGFALAELDLEIRGPGAIYGTMQHGQLDLRVAKLTDTKLIAAARQSAQDFIDKGENLLKYRHLADTVKKLRAVTNLN